jgi:hypothetical protein
LIPNLDDTTWCVCDQHVLTYLGTSLSREVLAHVAVNSTAAAMWAAISKIFASQSRSRVLHLHNQLVATKKKDLSIVTYFTTIHGYADEMAIASKALDDDDIVLYVLNSLNEDYNSLIEQNNGMTEPISPEDLYLRLLDNEACLTQQKAQLEPKEPYSMMVIVAARGNGGGGSKPHRRGGHGNRGGECGNPNNSYKDHQCQVCGRLGHTALHHWKHLTRVTMALRRRCMRQQPLILLI